MFDKHVMCVNILIFMVTILFNQQNWTQVTITILQKDMKAKIKKSLKNTLKNRERNLYFFTPAKQGFIRVSFFFFFFIETKSLKMSFFYSFLFIKSHSLSFFILRDKVSNNLFLFFVGHHLSR